MNPDQHRIIIHIDMDCFFAAVEQQDNPSLLGKPIAVTGSGKRTVITTSSYEARAFGVRTGMTTWEARQKCPGLIFVVGNNRKYVQISTELVKIFREFTPVVEVFSIDEAFLDITGSVKLFGSKESIARRIKERIGNQFGLTCSIGIAPNKLLAKLASEMEKPDGLTIIEPHQVAGVLDKVPIGKLCGIGKKTEKQLLSYGIRTCGDLGRFPVDFLKAKYGIVGERLQQMGLGMDNSPVIPLEDSDNVKSVGHSRTLGKDVDNMEEIRKHLLQLSEMVGRRARRHSVWGKTVTLFIRYTDFSDFCRQSTLAEHTNSSETIFKSVGKILDDLILDQPVRALGVRLTNLRYEPGQLPLFEEVRKKNLLGAAMDSVNDKFGDSTVVFGTVMGNETGSKVISPAWRPEGPRKVDVE